MQFAEQLAKIFNMLDRVLFALAVTAMGIIAITTTVDVFLRYVFASPIPWAYSVITYYLMAMALMLSLSDTQRHHEHIRIEILRQIAPRRTRAVMDIVAFVISGAICIAFAVLAYEPFIGAVGADERLVSNSALPAWPSYLMGPLGFGFCAIRFFIQTIQLVIGLRTGSEALLDEAGGSLEHQVN
jgi:TRAP-type C4-dicarboxylate transport system permease small subunit